MFTNQWSAYLLTKLSGNTTYTKSLSVQNIKNCAGTVVTAIGSSSSNYASIGLETNNVNVTSVQHANSGIKFGSGVASPTKDDYCLQSIFDANVLRCIAQSGSGTANISASGVYSVKYTNTLQNLSSASIQISEVGYVARMYMGGSTASAFLLWRNVLETPIILTSGEIKNVETIIEFPVG